jgi:hypothetical protein
VRTEKVFHLVNFIAGMQLIASRTKCQRFAKLKEVQANAQADTNCTTFNFAQPHPKPTHHPDKLLRSLKTFL